MNSSKSEIAAEIQAAYQDNTKLRIQGGTSKEFYGRQITGKVLSLSNYSGITEYEPSELYISAKSGTPLTLIEKTIKEQNQLLPCEPPYFKESATIGGTVACGLSGPRRAHAGNVRDCILGTEIINGKGEVLKFGGRVMKNVAGYDASRLMCGALGTLGVLTSVTMRLLPRPACEKTTVLSLNESSAISKMNQLANTPLPISGTFYDGQRLHIRLSGSLGTVNAAKNELGGDDVNDESFWKNIKEHRHAFFDSTEPLWRISVPPNAEKLALKGSCALEWNGGLRWYKTNESEANIRNEAIKMGGEASLFKGSDCEEKFHPLSTGKMKIHKNLKKVFDPAGILNSGKMFTGL